jgi:hypothetical protein
VAGPDAERALQWLCTNDVAVPPGRTVYTGMLNARGGYEADITVTRLSADEFLLVSSAATTERDKDHIARRMPAGSRAWLTDLTSAYAVYGGCPCARRSTRRVTGCGAVTCVDCLARYAGGRGGGQRTHSLEVRAVKIGAALFLIAVGAILRFGISTVSTHGISVHTIGDILMLVGVLGVLLWLVVWAPWSRGRRDTYRTRTYREVPPDELPPDGVRRYPAETRYEEEEYRR